jgi:hypothetical protein
MAKFTEIDFNFYNKLRIDEIYKTKPPIKVLKSDVFSNLISQGAIEKIEKENKFLEQEVLID